MPRKLIKGGIEYLLGKAGNKCNLFTFVLFFAEQELGALVWQ